MRHSGFVVPVSVAFICILGGVGAAGLGCAAADARKVGEFCLEESDCESGLCYGSECLDPDADYDLDGLRNGVEKNVTGTDYGVADTDGDGVTDGLEVGVVATAAADGDGDGLIDALESMMADADPDGDCIPDQYDAQNHEFNAEVARLVELYCSKVGVCGPGVAQIVANCAAGEPTCDYAGVAGYEAAETLCDGVDNDCDGETDEGLDGPDCPANLCVPECDDGFHCDRGQCVEDPCVPDCTGLVCGPDPACGTSCGICAKGMRCAEGQCVEEACVPDCSVTECGPDPVCGEDCGSCPGFDVCRDGVCPWHADTYEVSCGADGMCRVPAGNFKMGCDGTINNFGCSGDNDPQRIVYLDEFYIDKTEVTVEAYLKCVAAGGCTEPNDQARCDWTMSGHDAYPVNCVWWAQAKTYCEWAGKRLPTEAEWEKAARGTDGRIFPWGDEIASCERIVMKDDGNVGGCGTEASWPVCSKSPLGDSPYGLCDMSGNLFEWVSDWYGEDYYSVAPSENPLGPETGTHRVIRGGSYIGQLWVDFPTHRRDHTVPYNSTGYFSTAGFRCVRDL